MINFVKTRFNVDLQMNQVVPTFGTREVLFNFPQFALFNKTNPVMAFTNPFIKFMRVLPLLVGLLLFI